MSEVKVIGLDLAKNSFALVGLTGRGCEVFRKTLRRGGLMKFLARHAVCEVAMEACSGSHYWARQIETLGHRASLYPPQHVKAYQRGQKNDYNDALAIAEAHLHGRVREVRVKSAQELERQALEGSRDRVIRARTSEMNYLRSLLAEHGVVVAKGMAGLRRRMPELLEDAENGLSPGLRELFARHWSECLRLEEEVAWHDREVRRRVKEDEPCRRLLKEPGIGPVLGLGLRNWMGDGRQFGCGREASAAIGLVPRQNSTGGHARLGAITKRGDRQLRAKIIHGARAVAREAPRRDEALSRWFLRVAERRGYNKAVVALANKLVRIAWVIIARGEEYRDEARELGAMTG